jgi:hypothetical protein
MKPQKFQKKLSLNKKTIVNLGNGGLNHVRGGVGGPAPTSPFCVLSVNSDCLKCTGTCETCETCETCQTCAGQNTCGDIQNPCPGTITIP